VQRLHNLDSSLGFIREKRFYVVYGCSVGDSDATYFRAIFNAGQTGKTFLIYGYGQDAIESIKANIQRICGTSVSALGTNNQVHMLDVKKEEKTRRITRTVIDGYLKSL
jgi:hypothetical protein